MRSMVLRKPRNSLLFENLTIPQPQEKQVLVRVSVCGVCRTDLHICDGELKKPKLPLILGHQIVGKVIDRGLQANKFSLGERVGIPWLWKTCGTCEYCLSNKENLCDQALFTGYKKNGGFAEYCLAHEDFIFSIPDNYSNEQVAPLLCGGLIGFRALRFAENAKTIGFYGFGSSAHILIQIARYFDQNVYVFTRKGDLESQELAKNLGAVWVGSSDKQPPIRLDAAIVFAPIGELVPLALKAVKKGGIVVCAGIHMTDIPSFPYQKIYGERVLKSVTNLTREDGREFFELLKKITIQPHVNLYPLEKANEALNDLRKGKIKGSAVLKISDN